MTAFFKSVLESDPFTGFIEGNLFQSMDSGDP